MFGGFWNKVFRKIFRMIVWESVKQIQFFCGGLDLIHIVQKNQMNFYVE